MKKETLSGLVLSLLGLLGLIYLLAGDSHFPLIEWPYQALQGLVFSLVWGFGVSPAIGYSYAILLVVALCVICFALGHKLARSLAART